MACLEIYNNSNPTSQPPPMSPRISFSNDFVESHNSQHLLSNRAPPSHDFEFSVANDSMLSADQLFCQGRLLPFKNNNNSSNNGQTQRTLRDELLNDDDDDDDDDDDIDFSLKPPKGSSSSSSSSSNRWKGFLGLGKSHIGSKKSDRSGSFDDAKIIAFLPQDANLTEFPEEIMSYEGPSETAMEKRI
ncbi:uncharacterized protein LOC141638975 [Silene latifolia]|uniref:uncharacterized protein LOC141638975 n=1 Tax=Silene latifolia TaxID=37657 RepID=UPI003D7750A8